MDGGGFTHQNWSKSIDSTVDLFQMTWRPIPDNVACSEVLPWQSCIFDSSDVCFSKTPSEMDVAPWMANWVLMVSDGIKWHLIVFNGI